MGLQDVFFLPVGPYLAASSQALTNHHSRVDPVTPNLAAEPICYYGSCCRKTAEKYAASRKTARKKRHFSRLLLAIAVVRLTADYIVTVIVLCYIKSRLKQLDIWVQPFKGLF